jgi:hypothetical protein
MTSGLLPISSSWWQAPWDWWPVFFYQLNPSSHSSYVTSTLTRGWVCHLQSTVILRSKSHGTHDHILVSQIRDSPHPGGPGSHIYIPQEQGGPVILPDIGFPFHCLLWHSMLRWRCSTSPPYGILNQHRSHRKYCRFHCCSPTVAAA